jgi:zinc finger CCCH domain-containing protein 13
MGNFKHQSIRSSEREKDKDSDRDRERDLRDKEGQERIRSVSA